MKRHAMKEPFDVIIAGAGPVGLITALCFAQEGVRCAVYDQKERCLHPTKTGRLFAIAYDVKKWLLSKDLWPGHKGWPLTTARVTWFSDPAYFDLKASDIGQNELASMIEEGELLYFWEQKAHHHPLIRVFHDAHLEEITVGDDGVCLVNQEGKRWEGRVLFGADGKKSWVRDQLNIGVTCQDFDQRAFTCAVAYEGFDQAVDVFFPGGCLAFLPSGARQANLVWMRPLEEDVQDRPWFLQRINGLLQGHARCLGILEEYGEYALSSGLAHRRVGPSTILVGEAAQWTHPLAGQGLNVALRDLSSILASGTRVLKAGVGLQPWLESHEDLPRSVHRFVEGVAYGVSSFWWPTAWPFLCQTMNKMPWARRFILKRACDSLRS